MSLLSLLGIMFLLIQIYVSYTTIQDLNSREDKNGKTFIQIYFVLSMIIVSAEILLAWKVGPGFYEMRFLP